MPQTTSSAAVTDQTMTKPPEPFVPRLKIVSRAATHADTIRFLMDEIEFRYGIKPTAALTGKLLNLFEHLTLEEFADWADHLSNLSASDPEWYGLVECLTVHETYFNRDPGLLQAIRTQILPELIARAEADGSYSIRIWSAACSTGEEVYNLAFLLLDALLEAGHAADLHDAIVVDPDWHIQIVASDLSSRALDIATAAVYSDHGLGSFRGLPRKLWRYFEAAKGPEDDFVPGANHWRVKHYVRRHACFLRCNLLTDLPPVTGCDLTICRNVMIYFDCEAKVRVQGMLARSLKPGSFLVQGTTDEQLIPDWYHPEAAGGVLYYRKKT